MFEIWFSPPATNTETCSTFRSLYDQAVLRCCSEWKVWLEKKIDETSPQTPTT